MTGTPWGSTTTALRKLSERIDAVPTFREATLVTDNSVLFDTDSEPTTVRGSLARDIPAGARVLTMTLRHYVWVLGVKGGTPPVAPPAPVAVPLADFGSVRHGGTVQHFVCFVTSGVLTFAFRAEYPTDVPHGGTGIFGVNAPYRPRDFNSAYALPALGSGGGSGSASGLGAVIDPDGTIRVLSPGSRRAIEVSGTYVIGGN